MSEISIGVDVGTTVTKAVAFDADGTVLATDARPTQLHRLPGNRYEQDIDQVADSVVDVLAAVSAQVGADVAAIGVTGQGDGLWLVDAAGRQVRPAMSWLDGRSATLLEEWTAAGLVDEIFERTGSLVFSGASGPMLAWLDRHEPEALDRAATAAYCKDVVVQRLTGARWTDPSDASVPFLDPHTRTYDDDLVDRCGLSARAHLLAPVTAVPTAELSAEAAASTGLTAGVPVVAAPYDLVSSAVGAGVTDVGDGLLIVGTTLACQVHVDRVDTTGTRAGLTLATPVPQRWLRAMPAMVGTAALDWVLALVGASVTDLASMLDDSCVGANGVTVLPFLAESGERAPFIAPYASGRFDGIRLGTSRADMVRAMCEAIAYSARHCFEAAGLSGALIACGGGASSPQWGQIFADVLGRPMRTTPGEQVGARGAAVVAREAVGLASFAPIVSTEVQPDPAQSDAYAAGFERYLDQIEAARPAWQA